MTTPTFRPAAALFLLALAGAACGQCTPNWLIGDFGVPGAPNAVINTFTPYHDGTSNVLVAAGIFSTIGGISTHGVAKWNGTQWAAIGPNVTPVTGNRITALAVFDDGAGPALYVGGNFNEAAGAAGNAVAKWTGQTWVPLGAGLTRNVGAAAAFTMAAFDDGSGAALYVGGSFEFAGGSAALNFARWNGTTWQNIGNVNGTVNRLFVYDDGSGPALWAGGNITAISTAPATAFSGVARYTAATGWTSPGGGVAGGLGRVNAFAVHDDGTGSTLFIAGDFSVASGNTAEGIARWNGNAWSGLAGGGLTGGTVSGLASYDDGQGSALFAGGSFTMAGGKLMNQIARWTPQGWTSLGDGVTHPVFPTAGALLVHDDGAGPLLFVGGGFTTAGGEPAFSLARWGCGVKACYPNCDGSTTPPVLNVADFSCFLGKFAAGDPYANCDGSTIEPVLNVADFGCFLAKFAAGCN
jgi:trimeric autotransporter adhesin